MLPGFIATLFFGLKAAVLAVVVEAVVRIGKRVLKNGVMLAIAASAFVGIFFFDVPFPIIIVSAAAIGLVGDRVRPSAFEIIKGHQAKSDSGASASPVADALDRHPPPHTQPSKARALRVLGLCLVLWGVPIALLLTLLGTGAADSGRAGMLNGMGKDRGAALILEQAALASLTRPHDRTRAIAWYTMLQDLGHALGALLAGLPSLLEKRGPWEDTEPHRLTFMVVAALGVAILLLYAFTRATLQESSTSVGATISARSRRILVRLSALFMVDGLCFGDRGSDVLTRCQLTGKVVPATILPSTSCRGRGVVISVAGLVRTARAPASVGGTGGVARGALH